MRPDLADAIKSRGFWRVNIRPLRPPTDELALGACQSVVAQASVSLRGWDYPHIPHRQGDDTGTERHDQYLQAWTDWMGHREFWRMYRSGQFLHYRAFNEDWLELDTFSGPRSRIDPTSTPVLSVLRNLWVLTEIFEFASRLAKNQPTLYADGLSVNIVLNSGDEPRTLWIEDFGRMPFSYDRTTNAHSIPYTVQLNVDEASEPKRQAELAARHFFDRFGWDPQGDQLQADIEKLYNL